MWWRGGMLVEYDLIIARSVTYAQRMQRTLAKAGVRCQIFRAPRDLTDRGCAYAVRLDPAELAPALVALHRESLDPVQIFLYQKGSYREVAP
jgi:hypothetical protein